MRKSWNITYNELREYYIKTSKEKEERTKDYLSKISFINNKTGEVKEIEYYLKEKYHRDYLYYKGVSDYINVLANMKGYVPIFLTLTLPSNLHFYRKRKNGKIVRNYNSKEKNSFEINKVIKEGYQLLNKAFREIVRQGQRHDWKIDILYVRVVEPHKSFTPHVHAVLFVPPKKLKKMVKVIKNKIALYGLGKEHKIEILKDISKGSAYLLKYLQKTLHCKGDQNDQLYLYDGWRKSNRIRIFTHSNVGIDRNTFNKLVNHFILKEVKKYDYNIGRFVYHQYKQKGEWINPYQELSTQTVVYETEDERNYELMAGKDEFVENLLLQIALKNRNKKYFVVRKIKRVRCEKAEIHYIIKQYINKVDQLFNKIVEKIFETYNFVKKKEKISKWILYSNLDNLISFLKEGLDKVIKDLVELNEKNKYLMKYLKPIKDKIYNSNLYHELMSLLTIPFYSANSSVFKRFFKINEMRCFINKIKELKKYIFDLFLDLGIMLSEFRSMKIIEEQVIYHFQDHFLYRSDDIEVVRLK